jgi:hypothetical protein
MDYKEHVRTYKGFIRATVALVIINAVILLGMLIFLT